MVNGTLYEASEVKSGVPQDTVLGPILFLLLIINIDEDVLSNISLFADDTRGTGQVINKGDVEGLQKDLDRIYAWQSKNNMLFNSKKLQMLRFCANSSLNEETIGNKNSGAKIKNCSIWYHLIAIKSKSRRNSMNST